MTTPPTIQTNPLGPSPFQVAITQGDRVTNAWNQWFTQAQQKINVINLTLATLSGGSVTPGGYLAISSGGTSAGSAADAFNNLSPLTTNGDMLIYNSGNIRLPIGTDGYVLQVVSGIPTWVNASAGSSPLTTKGDVYGFNTAPARIPVGADSYVLTADSTNSLGVSWKPAGTPTLPITTKGDILGYSTVPARIPVGTNGTALVADSTQSLGVKWGTPAGTSPLTTKGDLFGFSTTNARVPVGTDGTILTADSTAALGVSYKSVITNGMPFLSPLVAPISSNFTPSSGNIVLTTKTNRMQIVSNVAASMSVATYNTALPSQPYTIDLAFIFPQVIPAINTYTGLFISDGTKYINFQFILYPGSSSPFSSLYLSEYPTLGGSRTDLISLWLSYQVLFYRITDDGTTRRYWVSANGLDYTQVYSHATNTYLTPTKCGIVSWCNNSTLASYKITVFHWLISNSILGDAP